MVKGTIQRIPIEQVAHLAPRGFTLKTVNGPLDRVGGATPTLPLQPNTSCENMQNSGFDTQFTADGKVFYDREVEHWIMFYFGVGKGGAHIMAAYCKDLKHWVRDLQYLYIL